jgi:putative glutamine amidotransferase
MNLVSAIYDSFYPFQEMGLFSDHLASNNPGDLTTDDCLVVWGGSDISPTLYRRPVSSRTGASHKPSMRDAIEWAMMKRAKELGIPIIGICRGAQMLCALAGGWLIQDTTGHGSSHDVITNDKQIIKVSSLHHQMLYPFEVDHIMVAHSKHPLSEYYLDVDEEVSIPVEPEFVYFPKEKGIAIQWHPEFMSLDCQANEYVQGKIKEFIL